MAASLHRVCVGLGSNLDDPAAQLTRAARQLDSGPCKLADCSTVYRSAPMGPTGQPDYLNAVVLLTTALQPLTLLAHLKDIEQSAGRKPSYHWGPRCIDLDILLFDTLEMTTDGLVIPHPGIHERDFVLVPLAEIASRNALPQAEQISRWLAEQNTGRGQTGAATRLWKTTLRLC